MEERISQGKVVLYYESQKVYASLSDETLYLLSKGYGNLDRDKDVILYSPVETLYLVEDGIAKVVSEGLELSFNELLNRLASVDENLWRDYVIYRDLRKRHYTVKEGLSQELVFRVFDKGEFQKDTAKFLVAPLFDGKSIKLSKLRHLVSVSRALNKELIISVVDRRNEIVYYIASQVDLRNL